MRYTPEQIIELAKEVELTDNDIEWDNLPLEKDRIYQILGSQTFDMYSRWTQMEDSDSGEAIMLATITKLLVENFVLNLKLNQGK